jgi:hypothetical protein
MGTADAMLSKLLLEDVRAKSRQSICGLIAVYRTIPRSSTSRHTILHNLDLPIASNCYKLDDSGLDIRVAVFKPEIKFPAWWFSLSDWADAKSRKISRNVSTEEFLAQQNDFWGSVRKVGGSPRPSFFDVEFKFSLSAR